MKSLCINAKLVILEQMQRTCAITGQPFEVTEDDLQFLEQISPTFAGKKYIISPPTLCNEERLRRKMAFRNERTFYKRKCDATGRDIVSAFSPDAPHTVYYQDEWWKDNWDALDYGRDFDFNRPFFEQFQELFEQVPLIGMWQFECENAVYNNTSFRLKNSYMNSNSDEGEDLMYCYVSEFCKSTVDCFSVHHCELCYSCIDCHRSHSCNHCQMLENCHECYHSSDLIGCNYCFGCHGLRQKEYYLFNEQVLREDFEAFMQEYRKDPLNHPGIEKSKELSNRTPKRPYHLVQCEDSTGDHLTQCRNCIDCFDVNNGEELRRVVYAPWNTKYSRDCYAIGGAELCYECTGGADSARNNAFLLYIGNGPSDSYYCILCVNGTKNCFGCVGLKKKEFCIFNKQYTQEEYEKLAARIVDHMKETGEWGEFYPTSMSPYAYNETIALDFLPLRKEEVLQRGMRWNDNVDDLQNVEKSIEASRLPDSITDVPDDVLNWAILCENTGRPYRIVKQELDFYRLRNIPIPHHHPDERHRLRMEKRNPRKLWEVGCSKCGQITQTSYAPDRPEIVYCEECYLAEVY